MRKDSGITLITLIITIIILIILAGIFLLIGDSGILNKAQETKFKTELAKIEEEFKLYVNNKSLENDNFELGTLNAGKNLLTYNTKPEDENGNIKTILTNSNEKYVECFEIIKGELIYNSQNEKELKWALEIGIKINPYLIVDGVLLSSDTNLMLMDENTGTIVVPESVTSIGEGTFANVNGMKRIIIPSTVKEIRQNDFYANATLEEVIILTDGNKWLEIIGNSAFCECSNLKKIYIPNTVKKIGRYAFSGCNSLSDVSLSNNIVKLENGVFIKCSNLKEIIIPEGIKEIGDNVFQNCVNLKKITFPKSLEKIGKSSFSYVNIDNLQISSENINFINQNGILLG